MDERYTHLIDRTYSKTGGRKPLRFCYLGWCRGRDLNPHDRYGQRILSPSRLPIPPPRQPDIKMEAAPGIEPGNKGFAGPCLTTWPRRLAIPHKKELVKVGSQYIPVNPSNIGLNANFSYALHALYLAQTDQEDYALCSSI